jgi:hypothetical protein
MDWVTKEPFKSRAVFLPAFRAASQIIAAPKSNAAVVF